MMSFEEAKKIFLNRGYIEVPGGTYYDADKWRESITVISKWLEQEPCVDAVRRRAVLDTLDKMDKALDDDRSVENYKELLTECYKDLTPVIPEKTGEWLRMSDLSEQEDDRYKCSYCGNVVHYRDRMNLYTFNSWCGRCGSNNRRQSEVSK